MSTPRHPYRESVSLSRETRRGGLSREPDLLSQGACLPDGRQQIDPLAGVGRRTIEQESPFVHSSAPGHVRSLAGRSLQRVLAREARVDRRPHSGRPSEGAPAASRYRPCPGWRCSARRGGTHLLGGSGRSCGRSQVLNDTYVVHRSAARAGGGRPAAADARAAERHQDALGVGGELWASPLRARRLALKLEPNDGGWPLPCRLLFAPQDPVAEDSERRFVLPRRNDGRGAGELRSHADAGELDPPLAHGPRG